MLARLDTGASGLAEADAAARLVVVGIGLALFALIESEKQMRLKVVAMRQG